MDNPRLRNEVTVEARGPNETDRQVADAIRELGRRLLEAYRPRG